MASIETTSRPVFTLPGSPFDRSFQELLLQFSAMAARGSDLRELLHFFCATTREFFGVSGAYYWSLSREDILVGEHAEGHLAERFIGSRLQLDQAAVVCQCVRERRALYVNGIQRVQYPMAGDFGARSMMGAPLVVSGEVVGAIVFLHAGDDAFFTDDLAAKATIVAAAMGSLLEAWRLGESLREDRRAAQVLVECAQSLHATLEASAVFRALARHVRELFRARAVVVGHVAGELVSMKGMAADRHELAAELEAYAASSRWLAELAQRAAGANEPQWVRIAMDDPLAQSIGSRDAVLVALRGEQGRAGIVVFPAAGHAFSERDRAMLRAVCDFGALALSNSELYMREQGHARELQQLLAISMELGGAAQLDDFLKQFAVRAAEFLAFERAFIALAQPDGCYLRHAAINGLAQPVDRKLNNTLAQRVLSTKQPYWSDAPTADAELDAAAIEEFGVCQSLLVPLVGPAGESLGILGVLDHIGGSAIVAEDVRRAQALAAEVAVALEARRNLDLSEEHRRRAENLMSLALELNSSLALPEFVRAFTQRASTLLGARVVALALANRNTLETVIVQDGEKLHDRHLLRKLNNALTDVAASRAERVVSGAAAEILGVQVADGLGWQDVVLAKLVGADDELLGMLCLAGHTTPAGATELNLLRALCGHAAVALENARLFSRIAQSNKQWAEIFDAITDYIVVHDEQHKVLRVNRSLADFIGVRPSELVGMGMRALLALAADQSSQPCPFCRPGNEQGRNDEYIHVVMDRTYLASTSRIHGALQDGVQTIHVLKDITDRREAERRYRELFDNIQEGLYFSVPQGRFVEVNDALVRMLGYASREELLQIDLATQLYPDSEQRDKFKAAIEKDGVLRNYEEPLKKKDGSVIHTLQNAVAVRDAQGRTVQYRGLMLDITELKRSQAQLQRERDFNDAILNNTQSMILVADRAGVVSYANRRCFEGAWQPDQVLGRRLAELVTQPSRARFEQAFEATLAGDQVDNLEIQLERGNASLGSFSVNLSPMRDEQRNVSSIIVVMTDITDAASLKAKLMHTEKMAAVGQLVSGVAHEVNNPLTAILGFADLLLTSTTVTEDARRDLHVIVQEAQRTKTIVQNLLSFARQVPPQREPVQVNEVLRRTIQLRSYDFASRGTDVTERFTEPLPEIVGDTHQLQQVFLNIMNNAFDAVSATGRAGTIEVRTAVQGGAVEIAFRDNGEGIVHPDRIFDPFFTTKEVGKGTGLGLSICYGIVREHGGEIVPTNNSDGPGATFTVRLPLASNSAHRAQAVSAGKGGAA
jgi:two-component system NtrC family sensor kinase